MYRNRKQNPGVEAGGEEEEESRVSISWEANRIKERGGFMEERQLNCLTSSTVIQRETAPVAILCEALLWEIIQADAVKENVGNLGIVLTEGVVREDWGMRKACQTYRVHAILKL